MRWMRSQRRPAPCSWPPGGAPGRTHRSWWRCWSPATPSGGLGLRANLGANWALLTATGTSTNILSKAAYDVARRRSTGDRVPRLAAALGYIGTELVKEVPYYLGAFGAASFTETVTAYEALIFLIGANLGAAAYEYGLARATRALVRRRPGRPGSGSPVDAGVRRRPGGIRAPGEGEADDDPAHQ